MKKIFKSSVLLLLVMSFSLASAKDKKIIVLDAGHGGSDMGAKDSELVEKDYTLMIAKKIIENNTDPDVHFVLLRDEDQTLSLQERILKINELKPDLVISLHLNKSENQEMNGYEIYVCPSNENFEQSKIFAEKINQQFKSLDLDNRGVKEQRFKIIRESQSPSVLIEMGFSSNENDRKFLASEKGQNLIVENILKVTGDF